MKRPLQITKTWGFILLLPFLAACGSASTETPDPIQGSPAITPTSTPTPWQAPAEWWTKPQVLAFSQPFFIASANNPDFQTIPPEYYLDFYSQAGVALASWNDIRGMDNWEETYPEIVADLHSRGFIVAGNIGMISFLMDRTATQELQPAFLRDPYGNALETNPCLADTPCSMPILSVIHPAAKNYYLSVVKKYIDAGVDGISVDELAYGSAFNPDFNENTMLEFRQYLLAIYTPEELAVFGQQYGISDFNTLDYASVARKALPPDRSSLYPDEMEWNMVYQIPFWVDYQRFLRIKNHEFALWLIEEGKTYAMEMYGKDIPFSANLNILAAPEALYLLDALDYVDLEYFYQSQGYFPRGRALTAVHIAQGFGKQPYLVTGYGDTDPDLVVRGMEKNTNLFRTMISEAYGTGSALTVEEGLHGVKQDINALAPYYRFPKDYPWLFNDLTSAKGRVGLVFLWEGRDIYNYTDLRGLGQMLADSGYQFNIIFGAEEFTWYGRPKYLVPAPDHPLTLAALTPNQLVILPQLDEITPNHADILLQYVKQGGNLLVFTTPEMLSSIDGERGQSNPAIRELLDAIYTHDVAVGNGRIISVEELWGKPYATDPQPAMRQPLLDLLVAEGVLPEVSMSSTNYVGAFMHLGADSLTAHFVNYDYNPDTDTTTPAGPLQVELTLPNGLFSDTPSVYLFSPVTQMQVIAGEMNGNNLLLTLPQFDIWSVLWIGRETILQEQIAAYPTPTPESTSIPTPSIDPGFVIYNDEIAGGWHASTYNVELNLDSTALVYQGSKAVEIIAQSSGAFDLSYQQSVDTSGYNCLVLFVNPASMDNLNFSITTYNQQQSLNYVFLTSYLGSKPLQLNEWRKVVIPLRDLNPEGVDFDRLYFQNESRDSAGFSPATFYLDEIYFAIDPTSALVPTRTQLPTSTPMPTIDPGYTIYDDALAEGWQASPDNAEIKLNSTVLISHGLKAIEVEAQGWGALDFSNDRPVDTSGYNRLVLFVNPASTNNLNFSVTIFDHQQSVNYVFLADYLEGKPLLLNEWRRIVIPLSDLNPNGAAFNRIFIQNESDNPANFILDEIFFAK